MVSVTSVMASVTVCDAAGHTVCDAVGHGLWGVVGAIFYPIYFNTSFQVVFHKNSENFLKVLKRYLRYYERWENTQTRMNERKFP
jgi:hypothetical protein